MNSPNRSAQAARDRFDSEVQDVLHESFYTPPPASQARAKRLGRSERPTHYKVICISMYTKDLESLDAKVAELKRRGYTKANRSALIRHALAVVDLDGVPRGI